MYFESHAHYDDKKFDEDRDELLENLKQNDVDYIINVGADMKSSLISIELSHKYSFVYAAVGIHPHDAQNMKDTDIKTLKDYCNDKKVVAIGEIGLDYYYDFSPRQLQRNCFKKQLELCEVVNKPVIIHSRDASQECFDMIKKSNVRNGVIHAFSGSVEMAKAYIDMGFYIGIGGIITFKNARKLIEVVENISIENILIETDSPYLSPVPNRGTRNNSQNLKFIAEKIGQIKQLEPKIVAQKTKNNALSLFGIK